MRLTIKVTLFSIAGIAMVMTGFFSAIAVQASQTAKVIDHPYYVDLSYVERTSFGRPIRIKIPAIGVDAMLENVGLKPDGSIGAPKGPVNAGWFYSGPLPGQKGSTVIDGHYGWRDGIQAVFDNLSKLHKGDEIYVEDQKGIIAVFVVTGSEVFGENDGASRIFSSNDDKSHLNLITCGGIWNKAKQSYSDRLVVFSDISKQ